MWSARGPWGSEKFCCTEPGAQAPRSRPRPSSTRGFEGDETPTPPVWAGTGDARVSGSVDGALEDQKVIWGHGRGSPPAPSRASQPKT